MRWNGWWYEWNGGDAEPSAVLIVAMGRLAAREMMHNIMAVENGMGQTW